ncbi:redoxin domain-containing protein [Ilumatobacter sp.]|uniref:redoxin domain-containing protein n=1 Tax=Ilumatobacter sp. TaxID=1967498 RepID=UPI0037511100
MPNSRRQSIRVAAILGVAAVVLAACGGGGDQSNSSPVTAADTSAVEAPGPSSPRGEQTPQVAELAAALTEAFGASTTLADSAAFDGASLAGGDSVVWFWAPWCTICRGEAPDVADVAEQFGSQVNLIGVPGRGQLDEMVDFVNDTGTGSITHVPDLNGDIWSAFGVYGQPAFAFIDDDGSVEVFIGGMGGDALAERIDQLIAT